MKEKVYRVRTQYIFEGVFEVVAESKEDARKKGYSELRIGNGWEHSQHPAR